MNVIVEAKKPTSAKTERYRLVCGAVKAMLFFHSFTKSWHFRFTTGLIMDGTAASEMLSVVNKADEIRQHIEPLDYQI